MRRNVLVAECMVMLVSGKPMSDVDAYWVNMVAKRGLCYSPIACVHHRNVRGLGPGSHLDILRRPDAFIAAVSDSFTPSPRWGHKILLGA